MSLRITSLNSGSNGNCYYIGNSEEAVLIDAGISCREVEKRMKRLDLPMSTIKAVFISHEHGDHILGVAKLSKKFQLPVYITPATLRATRLELDPALTRSFTAFEPVSIGGLSVTGFPKYHDAIDPHSFIVANETVKVGVFTDIGRVCRHVIQHFRQCHAAFLESNYDIDMLNTGPYPAVLKDRIRNGEGHLSNLQALQLFQDHRPDFMSHMILSHLSHANNTHELVETLFSTAAGKTQIAIASRLKEMPILTIHARQDIAAPVMPRMVHARQLELF